MLDVLEYQTALASVSNASTNSAFLNAVTKVDTLLKQFTEKYDGKSIYTGITGFKNGADKFDLTKVNTNATYLAAYRTAVKTADAGDKNQAKDILAIVNGENATLNAAAISAALTNLNSVTSSTTSAKIVEYLTAVQVFDTTLTASTKAEIKSAYADLYKTEVIKKLATEVESEKFKCTVDAVNAFVSGDNETADKEALLKALNDATTVTEVSTVLINLNSTAFINVHADDKLTIATAVLVARNGLTDKKFDTEDNTFATAVTTAVSARTTALQKANKLNSASTITEAQTVLADVAQTAYASLSNVEKVNAAQKLIDSLVLKEDGSLKTPYKTLKAVLTAAGL